MHQDTCKRERNISGCMYVLDTVEYSGQHGVSSQVRIQHNRQTQQPIRHGDVPCYVIVGSPSDPGKHL